MADLRSIVGERLPAGISHFPDRCLPYGLTATGCSRGNERVGYQLDAGKVASQVGGEPVPGGQLGRADV